MAVMDPFPWETHDEAISNAWLALRDSVDAKWREWVAFSDENRILYDIAVGLSGLDGQPAWVMCCGYPGQLAEVVKGARLAGDILTFPRTPIQPAWVYWCNLAADAIVEVMKAKKIVAVKA